MTLLDRITAFHGRLSDTRVVWWPFLSLKPVSATEPISLGRVALMVPCFAAWMMIGWLAKELVTGRISTVNPGSALRVYAILLLAFTVLFNTVTRPLWNRRARSLAESETVGAA